MCVPRLSSTNRPPSSLFLLWPVADSLKCKGPASDRRKINALFSCLGLALTLARKVLTSWWLVAVVR